MNLALQPRELPCKIMKRLLLYLLFALPALAQTTTFVPLASTWKYRDNGTDQGTEIGRAHV